VERTGGHKRNLSGASGYSDGSDLSMLSKYSMSCLPDVLSIHFQAVMVCRSALPYEA